MADEVGYEYGLELAANMTPVGTADAGPSRQRSVRAAVATVADALTAHGFAAHTEERGRIAHDRRRALPVRRGRARSTRTCVCAVDRGMIRGMLAGLYGETHPRHTESRPAGDEHCVARV